MAALRCLAFISAWLFTLTLEACASADAPPRGPPAFDADELDAVAQDLVATHNDVRARATPTPSPALRPLTWDDDIAAVAQAWAEGCVFEHSGGDLGENLAFFSGETSTGADVVALWAAEAADYDLASNGCAAGRVCGHYTQIVWRDTTRVGCGAALCTINGSEGRSWVCNYNPPGNWVGERPY